MHEYLFDYGDSTAFRLVIEYARSANKYTTFAHYVLEAYGAQFFRVLPATPEGMIQEGLRFADPEKYTWFILKLA